jgi:hypothetical protein
LFFILVGYYFWFKRPLDAQEIPPALTAGDEDGSIDTGLKEDDDTNAFLNSVSSR